MLPLQHHHFLTVQEVPRVHVPRLQLQRGQGVRVPVTARRLLFRTFSPLILTLVQQVKFLRFRAATSALGHSLRRAQEAQSALALQDREPGGEDGEGRGGRAGVPFCPASAVLASAAEGGAAFAFDLPT